MHSRTALTLSLAVLLVVAAGVPGAAAASGAPVGEVASVDGQPIAQANGSSTTENAPDVRVVSVDHSPRPVSYGQEMEIEATIHNRGGAGTDIVELLVDEDRDGYLETDEIKSLEYVDVSAGEWTTVQFTYTVRGIPGEYRLAIRSDVNERGYRFEVLRGDKDGSNYSITSVDAPESVAQSREVRVNATVENVGDSWFTQPTEYRVDLNGDGRLTPNETVDQEMSLLGPRYVETFEFTANPTLSSGTVRHGVFTRDDSWTTTLNVTDVESPPENGSDTGDGDGSDTGNGDGSDTGNGDGSDTGNGDGSDTGDGEDPENPDEDGDREPTPGNDTPTGDPVRLSLAPDEVSFTSNATTSLTLRVHNATEGVDLYDLFVRSDDVADVEIVGFDSAVEARIQMSSVTDNGSAIRVQGVNVVSDETGVVKLGTVTIRGADDGSATLATDVVDLGHSTDRTYTVSREGTAAVEVTDPNSTDGTPNGTLPDPVEPLPEDPVNIRLSPVGDVNGTTGVNASESELAVGANRTYELVASNLSRGLDAATLRIVTTNDSAVRIVDGTAAGVVGVDNRTDSGNMKFNSVYRAESESATLGRITLGARAPGEANVSVRDVQLYHRQGAYEAIDADDLTVSVAAEPTGPPPVVGDARPTDPDEDGRYEDLNGDGEFSLTDVSVLLGVYDQPPIQNNTAAFDFDGDGTVMITDVSTLLADL